MGIGCLICDDLLESPAPEMACNDVTSPKKTKSPPSSAKKPVQPSATPTDSVVTPCGHLFHELCLTQWFKNKKSGTCPVCRKMCTKARLIRIFPSMVEDGGSIPPTPTNNQSQLANHIATSSYPGSSTNKFVIHPAQKPLVPPRPAFSNTTGSLSTLNPCLGSVGSGAAMNHNRLTSFVAVSQASSPTPAAIKAEFSRKIAMLHQRASTFPVSASSAGTVSSTSLQPQQGSQAITSANASIYSRPGGASATTIASGQLYPMGNFPTSPLYSSMVPGAPGPGGMLTGNSAFTPTAAPLTTVGSQPLPPNFSHALVDIKNKYDELKVIHQTLIADYTELQQKHNDVEDQNQVLKVQLESCDEEIRKLRAGGSSLARNANASWVPSLGSGFSGSRTQKRAISGSSSGDFAEEPLQKRTFPNPAMTMTRTYENKTTPSELTFTDMLNFSDFEHLVDREMYRNVNPYLTASQNIGNVLNNEPASSSSQSSSSANTSAKLSLPTHSNDGTSWNF